MSFFAMKKSGQAPKIMIQSNRSEKPLRFLFVESDGLGKEGRL